MNYVHLREPENKHKIEYSNGWCGTCDDQAKPNSNNILHIMQIISSIQFMGNKIYYIQLSIYVQQKLRHIERE